MARPGEFAPDAATAIVERAGFRCERCGAGCAGTRGVDWSVQHRRARGMGGTNARPTVAGGVLLCGSATTGCHGWVESHPHDAAAAGWRLGPNEDPREVPILHWSWGSVLLDDRAGYVRLAPEGSPL